VGAVDTVDVLRDNVKGRRLSRVSSTRVEHQVGIVTMHAIEATETGGPEVNVDVRAHYPLKDAAQAHRDLEGRRTVGSVVLTP